MGSFYRHCLRPLLFLQDSEAVHNRVLRGLSVSARLPVLPLPGVARTRERSDTGLVLDPAGLYTALRVHSRAWQRRFERRSLGAARQRLGRGR